MAAEDRILEQSQRTWHSFCRFSFGAILAVVILLALLRLFLV
jgi:hypothetical protein